MAKSRIRQWAERLLFRDKRKQTHDEPTARQRDNDADSTFAAPPAQRAPRQAELQEQGFPSRSLGARVKQNNCHPPAFPPAWASDWGEDKYGLYADLLIGGGTEKELRQRFRWIAPGEFMMGSPLGEQERNNDEELHKVRLTKGYWLADTAVTQAVWQAVTDKNPADFQDNERNPVEKVSWNDAQDFITELNQRIKKTGATEEGMAFRLPTEAEWEHACRAGTET
ncbi:MAG: formylglycine-generating enzyme family protein, partial [Candidatus Electrothrix sp. AR5]|nr:formylglycine-generating enzyme family protein [Candidatus Electrothrix sp. AR5]